MALGSITAFYVLSEGDDQQDPIADAAWAILDEYIVLSRALAETGHFSRHRHPEQSRFTCDAQRDPRVNAFEMARQFLGDLFPLPKKS